MVFMVLGLKTPI